MKRLKVVILMGCLFSCSSGESDAIEDFVSKVGNTKTDMKFKILSKENIGSLKGQDSIALWQNEMNNVIADSPTAFIDSMVTLVQVLEKQIAESDTTTMGRHMRTWYRNTTKAIPQLKMGVAALKRYSKDPAAEICNKIKCTYSIENPFLNGAKQEMTKVFYYSIYGKRVTAVE